MSLIGPNDIISIIYLVVILASGVTAYVAFDVFKSRKRNVSIINPIVQSIPLIQNKVQDEDERKDGDEVKIIIDIPKEIKISIDPQQLLDFIIRSQGGGQTSQPSQPNQQGVSVEALLRKGFVKEG